MGLIHLTKEEYQMGYNDTYCTVHDLSVLGLQQSILEGNLHDLLFTSNQERRYRFVDDADGTSHRLDDPGMPEFQSFPRLPTSPLVSGADTTATFSVHHLYFVYEQQYNLLHQAMAYGAQRCQQAPNQTHHTRLHQYAARLVAQQPSPTTILQRLRELWRVVKAGDILDLCGHRGTGYVYVSQVEEEPGYDGSQVRVLRVVKTRGPFGQWLPAQAFPQVQRQGLEFFREAAGLEVVGCLLPRRVEISTGVELQAQDDGDMPIDANGVGGAVKFITQRDGQYGLLWRREQRQSFPWILIEDQKFQAEAQELPWSIPHILMQ